MLTAKEAADQVGKTKAAILKAIKTGRLSATKGIDGEWQIEPVELFRVYRLAETSTANSAPAYPPVHTELAADLAVALNKLEALEQERQRERHQLESTIDDLRRRLDAEGEERRKLTALLTDQRMKQPEPPPQSPQKAQEGRLGRVWRILTGRA